MTAGKCRRVIIYIRLMIIVEEFAYVTFDLRRDALHDSLYHTEKLLVVKTIIIIKRLLFS
jgi:hypothetical protein